jgi:voltage-gated potassium channel Kch
MPLKVYRRAQNWHSKGRYYSMHLNTPDGELLVDRSSDPEHAAARALVARGYLGPFVVLVPSAFDPEKWIVSLRFESAEAAAKVSVVEEDRHGLKVIRYRPGPTDRARNDAAVGCLAAQAAI